MNPPVIPHLRHMIDIICLIRQAKQHIIILTPVIFLSKASCFFQKATGKNREMTNIIIAPKTLRRKVRLKMNILHPIRCSVKRQLIRINKFPLMIIDRLHHIIQCRWMKNIIMIQQCNIFSCAHLYRTVGIF